MGRYTIGAVLAAFTALALAPSVEAFPWGEVGANVVMACIWVAAFAAYASSGRSHGAVLVAATVAVASLGGSWVAYHYEGRSPLLPLVLEAVLSIAPCEGGCALARTDFLHALLMSLCIAAVLVPLAKASARARRLHLERRNDV